MSEENNTPGWIPEICTGLGLLRAVLLSLVISCLLAVLRYGLGGFNALVFGPLALFVLWLTLLCALWLCVLQGQQHRFRSWTLGVVVLIGVALISALATWLFKLALGGISAQVELPLPSVTENVIIALLVSAVILRFLAVQTQLGQREQQLNRARYDALQARIKPHFLFNTLNAIAALVNRQPAAAERALLDLSDMLRSSIGRERTDWTLADEVDICIKYLGIEKLRMGDRLVWDIDASAEALAQPFPQLALQPLVENAVLHGLQPNAAAGCLELHIALQSSCLVIRLRNEGGDEDGYVGTGQALANVRARLEAYSPRLRRFDYGPQGDGYLVNIELELP